MTVDRPIGINDPSGTYTYDARTWRRAQSGSYAHDTDALSARPGVLHGLATTVSGLNVTVGVGSAVVTPQVGTNGSYEVVLSASEAKTLDARDGTYSRIDVISLQVLDPDVSGAVRTGQVVVTKGTPDAVPAIPSPPAGTLPLARATVPPGTAAVSLVDLRQWTAPVGATIPCTSGARPSGAWLRPGQTAFETDSGRYIVWSGTTWVAPYGAMELGGGVDLNSVTTPGTYMQSQSAEAQSGSNYPINPIYKIPIAGKLDVAASDGGSFIYQTYTEYHSTRGQTWTRTYDGTWGGWICAVGALEWTPCTINSGFAAAGTAPAVRMGSGGKIEMRGVLATTGFSGTTERTPLTIPEFFRPTGDWVYTATVGNTPAGTTHTCIVKPGGDFNIRPNSSGLPGANFQLYLPTWSVYN